MIRSLRIQSSIWLSSLWLLLQVVQITLAGSVAAFTRSKLDEVRIHGMQNRIARMPRAHVPSLAPLPHLTLGRQVRRSIARSVRISAALVDVSVAAGSVVLTAVLPAQAATTLADMIKRKQLKTLAGSAIIGVEVPPSTTITELRGVRLHLYACVSVLCHCMRHTCAPVCVCRMVPGRWASMFS